ncbi:subunit 17 of mediator complex-domain-containing protein [Piptocephalis cylindrospora]|uniref:Mediator of RNA polymerase II transcription subunit 17 n=1 Tax=Piptocephalis cylindrospora TaxID=1907219 RepID=A0A4P9Y149_9FUNG|nr:subunit 17 of mediator complex-domain-containing protein [Piptocephalis cylindrospora]|eukprot:RKP12394.1 subunit 17 of mediator complex-domain-containing protein [Piptocephalis cylindrospora]
MPGQKVFLDTSHLPSVYDYTSTGQVILERERPVDETLTEKLVQVWKTDPPSLAQGPMMGEKDKVQADEDEDESMTEKQETTLSEKAQSSKDQCLSVLELKSSLFNSFREAHTEVQYTMDLLNALLDTQAQLTKTTRRSIVGNTPTPLPSGILEAADAQGTGEEDPTHILKELRIRFGAKVRGLGGVHDYLEEGADHIDRLLAKDRAFWSVALAARSGRWPLRASVHPQTGKKILCIDYSLRDAGSSWQGMGLVEIHRDGSQGRSSLSTILPSLPSSPPFLSATISRHILEEATQASLPCRPPVTYQGNGLVERLSRARHGLLHTELHHHLVHEAALGAGRAGVGSDGLIRASISSTRQLTLGIRRKEDESSGSPSASSPTLASTLDDCAAQISLLSMTLRLRRQHRRSPLSSLPLTLSPSTSSSNSASNTASLSTDLSSTYFGPVLRPLRLADRLTRLQKVLWDEVLRPCVMAGLYPTMSTLAGGSGLCVCMDGHRAHITPVSSEANETGSLWRLASSLDSSSGSQGMATVVRRVASHITSGMSGLLG